MKITNEDAILTGEIRSKQKVLALSDASMAKFLNISRSLYRETQSGTRPIGLTYLSAVVNKFPDIDPTVVNFLRDKHNSRK
jgi:hypothetical protein